MIAKKNQDPVLRKRIESIIPKINAAKYSFDWKRPTETRITYLLLIYKVTLKE